jgi:hypothetical protein
MLDTYKKLESLGVIGRMMKVDSAGHPIIDLKGEIPGTMVSRPFQEFPKVVRRWRRDGTKVETVVGSKSEEMRLLAESADEVTDIPLSPLERERNELARENAEQNKALAAMQEQMARMMADMARLTQAMDQKNAEDAALGAGSTPVRVGAGEMGPANTSGKGIEALALGKAP